MEYQKIIKNLRTKLVLSQQEFAELLVSFTSVNRWENGKHDPTIIAKEKLKIMFKENEIQLEEMV